jgi:hypothetical protein
MKFIQISFDRIKQEIEDFLKTEYNKASILFSNASPYGQILGVIENLQQLSLLYLKSTLNQFDLSNASSTNKRIIRNAAIFAGHNPTRSISATGTLKFTLKTAVDIEKEIPGGKVIFLNKTTLSNKTNSLDYSLDLGTDRVSHILSKNYNFFIPVIQGKWETKTYTGSGDPLQTLYVNVSGNKDVENFRVEILVNGEIWSIKKHIYDLLPDEKAVVTKSGFDEGLDIIFGNGGFGAIPELGSIITVNYLKTDGADGNIFRRTPNDWNFVDDVFDGFGGTLDMGKLFDIDIHTDINFGANAESSLFTRSLLPMVSNNYVLALPQQYAYEIKKLGVFSHVNAYERNGTVFVAVTPNINLFKNQNNNYFDIDIAAFSLDDYEIDKIGKYLRTGGNIQLTKNFSIVNPTLSYYVMNIFVIPYSDVTDDSLNNQIYEVISDYFLNLNRIDRIPKLDLIKALSNISDIHSVDLQFISKKNEDYHKEAIINLQNQMTPTIVNGGSSLPKPPINYDSSVVLGLDPILGDIIYDASELPIIRGGWSNRNDVLYSSDIKSSGLKSVNIIKRGTVDVKNKPM